MCLGQSEWEMRSVSRHESGLCRTLWDIIRTTFFTLWDGSHGGLLGRGVTRLDFQHSCSVEDASEGSRAIS